MNNNIHDYIQSFDECEMIAEGHDIPRRTSRDTETNTFGRQLIQFCKINDFLILNGRTASDATGSFTCIANKGRSIVDYFIVSRNKILASKSASLDDSIEIISDTEVVDLVSSDESSPSRPLIGQKTEKDKEVAQKVSSMD